MKLFNVVRILRDIDDAGGSSSTGDDQMGFMNDLLDGAEAIDPDFTGFEEKETSEAKPEEPEEKEVIEPDLAIEESQEADDQVEETESASIIESLRAQILALSEQVGVDPKVQKVQETVETEAAKEQKTMQEAKEVLETFLTEDELDRILDEPQLINKAIKRSQDAVLGSMGAIIQAEVNKQLMVNKAVTEFYTVNEDLLPYAKYVQFVMGEVEARNRDKSYAEIFQTTADECRKRLGLSTKVQTTRETNKASGQKPAFAGSKRGNARPTKPEFFDPAAADMLG